jgi:flagellar biosynthesis/type III secretory pathway M-ring protein FliF/YscJ
MLRMKDTNKLIKNVLRALPAIPFIAPKKTSSVLPFVLGALGVAVAGGIAAVMVFSPRTRYRALDIAKDGYGKVKGQLDQLGISEKLGMSHAERNTTPGGYSNGLVNENAGSSYSSTGV